MGTVHCFRDDALGFLDAVGIAGGIKAGLVSREEVIEAAVARVEQIESMYLVCPQAMAR